MNTKQDLSPQLTAAAKVMDRMFRYKMKFHRIPSIAFGIVYKNKVIFSKGYGYADLAKKLPATERTCYRIASISKVFTAVAIMQLVEQRKIHLDDAVHSYLPWFTSSKDANLAKITIRQILTHTAGLERDGNTPHWTDGNFPDLAQIKKHITDDGATVFTPLETWKYSNFGYAILGELIHVVSGVTYEAYMQKNIIDRLNLSHTSPILIKPIKQHLANGYGRDIPEKERMAFPQYETNAMAAATGFSSNVLDLCTFMSSLFDGNEKLLTDDSKRQLRQIQWVLDKSDSDKTLGFFSYKVNGTRLLGHTGGFQGYTTVIIMDVEKSIGVVILTNGIDIYPRSLAQGVFHTLDYLCNHFADFSFSKSTEENLEKYEGTFTSVWEDSEVIEVNNGLILAEAGATMPLENFNHLKPIRKDVFKNNSGDGFGSLGELIKFEFDGKGKVKRMLVGPNPKDVLDYT